MITDSNELRQAIGKLRDELRDEIKEDKAWIEQHPDDYDPDSGASDLTTVVSDLERVVSRLSRVDR
jgi:hypothetical protein